MLGFKEFLVTETPSVPRILGQAATRSFRAFGGLKKKPVKKKNKVTSKLPKVGVSKSAHGTPGKFVYAPQGKIEGSTK